MSILSQDEGFVTESDHEQDSLADQGLTDSSFTDGDADADAEVN